jgi:hypothetical protein
VITPVVDFALGQEETDPRRIAIMGISFGGYFVPRAMAFEKRIPFCIVNGGVYDFHKTARLTPELEKMLDSAEGSGAIDREVYERMEKSPSLRWAVGNGMFTFHAKTPSEWFRMTRAYTLEGVTDRITCTILVVVSEDDRDMPGSHECCTTRSGLPGITCSSPGKKGRRNTAMGRLPISERGHHRLLDYAMKAKPMMEEEENEGSMNNCTVSCRMGLDAFVRLSIFGQSLLYGYWICSLVFLFPVRNSGSS